MKKKIVLLFACAIFGSLMFTGCANTSQKKTDEATEVEMTEGETESTKTETVGTEITQADIEERIIGTWIVAERDGQPALTNEKIVITCVSPTKAYISASLSARPEPGKPWVDLLEANVSISGNKLIFTWPVSESTIIEDEISITNITNTEQQGDFIIKSIENGKETIIIEENIRFVKVNDDYSSDIIGTWEGRCTSGNSVFDDGQDHRWEYKDDGTFVYYVKDGDNWVPGDDTLNEYFVGGNLLCTRWLEVDEECREWWEISIEGDTMNWTALREGEDGNTFTASFEMTKVEK